MKLNIQWNIENHAQKHTGLEQEEQHDWEMDNGNGEPPQGGDKGVGI